MFPADDDKQKREALQASLFGAENGARTRDLNLGKVALYQLSYFRNGTANIERKIISPKFLLHFWKGVE